MSDHAVLAVSEKLPPSKALNITLWIVQVLTAAVLCIADGVRIGPEQHERALAGALQAAAELAAA
jgi:hypothetical protein